MRYTNNIHYLHMTINTNKHFFHTLSKTLLLSFLFALIFLNTPHAFADITTLQGSLDGVKSDIADQDAALAKDLKATEIITNVIQWMLAVSVMIALAALIWGGIMYILALGDENRAAKAKKILLYAIVGLIIVGTSYAIISAVKELIIAP